MALIRTAYCGHSYPTAVIRTQWRSSASYFAALVRALWNNCAWAYPLRIASSRAPYCATARLPNTRMAIAARSLLWPPAGTPAPARVLGSTLAGGGASSVCLRTVPPASTARHGTRQHACTLARQVLPQAGACGLRPRAQAPPQVRHPRQDVDGKAPSSPIPRSAASRAPAPSAARARSPVVLVRGLWRVRYGYLSITR